MKGSTKGLGEKGAGQPPFKRLLVANRGEIAIRICRAATELGIRTVAIYSYEDRFALYRFKADEAYQVGKPGEPIKAYLDYERILELAVSLNIDAIHPGYGFLSENADFARACAEKGITFVGPSPDVLEAFGDKVQARRVAQEAGVQVIPGTTEPVAGAEQASEIAAEMGFPVVLKAVSGGGGKGIRVIERPEDLAEAFSLAQSEAQSSFGRADIYIEKCIEDPRHIEIQLLGDQHGQVVHLFERDCSIQRRHQKVVEVAPALGLRQEALASMRKDALRMAEHVGYYGLGTVEFLVDRHGKAFFLEVNPRVQVEHTVTEMVTGVDLLAASIHVAAGKALSSSDIGIGSQADVRLHGAAIQCRITTEDPLNGFAPDTGTIIAYRPAAGFGIRLDEGHGTAGGVITPHYDSLLVKVSAWGQTIDQAAAKMRRSLREFRIRGVKHNIPVLLNVVGHPRFLSCETTTDFFEQHAELFDYPKPRDRATKLLRYLAEVTVNNPHGLETKKDGQTTKLPAHTAAKQRPAGSAVRVQKRAAPSLDLDAPELRALAQDAAVPTAKEVFDDGGVTGLQAWLKAQTRLQLTDTTMRDAHQSLFATRLRTKDILAAAPFYREYGHRFFSLEMWGGATFDTSLRFLKEDPWERLAAVREQIPRSLLQMLLRGDNAVGYTNYPAWVVREFIHESARAGLDLFRIFDCLNQPEKMQIAIDEVKKRGAIAEVCLCYTGNVIGKDEDKYTLSYYVDLAKQLVERGADILAIKDMAGLLRPQAASLLIKTLRQEVDVPLHLHMHDTAGVGVATLLQATEAGCDIVDGAMGSMAGLTSQPSLNALVASLAGRQHCPETPLAVLDPLSEYWGEVRQMYADFDPGIKATSTDVYEHEIPGGQYSNLFQQAQKVGLSASEFRDLTHRYREVNELLGNIIKVTPSSKVVGDFALLLHKNELTGESYLQERPHLDYPDSVLSFFRGEMGTPYGGFREDVRELVLKAQPSSDPSSVSVSDSGPNQEGFAGVKADLQQLLQRDVTNQDVLSYSLYPKVFLDFVEHRDLYGRVEELATAEFFHGLQQNAEIAVDIEAGKTLFISLSGISEGDQAGKRTVFFQLNGFPREIELRDQFLATSSAPARPKAQKGELGHVGASMPAKVLSWLKKVGDAVEEGETLLVTEAMKMEYAVSARRSGVLAAVHAQPGESVEEGDLLAEVAAIGGES